MRNVQNILQSIDFSQHLLSAVKESKRTEGTETWQQLCHQKFISTKCNPRWWEGGTETPLRNYLRGKRTGSGGKNASTWREPTRKRLTLVTHKALGHKPQPHLFAYFLLTWNGGSPSHGSTFHQSWLISKHYFNITPTASMPSLSSPLWGPTTNSSQRAALGRAVTSL